MKFTNMLSRKKFLEEKKKKSDYEEIIEVVNQYVTVVDTRHVKVADTFLYRYPLSKVISTNKLRLTGYGYHNGNTNMFSIKELFIYTEE